MSEEWMKAAREDLAIWKRRALEAEEKLRQQGSIIDHLTLEAQGESRMGEPDIPAAQEHYPECDYCGVASDHHPWHGSGLLNGEESRHIHACDSCRHLLPTAQKQQVEWRTTAVMLEQANAGLAQLNGKLRAELSALKAQQVGQESEPAPKQHPDDAAVDRFAAAMKAKLARSREKGRHGWQNCTAPHLSAMLYDHLYKADPLDVGNFAMMLHQNGQAIELPFEARGRHTTPQPAPAQDVADVRKMARALSDRQADACNVDREDQWKLYSEDFVADVEAMLAASHDKGQ